MKTIRFIFCLCFSFCSFSLFAQEEEISNGLLFPEFEKGIVVFKNGTRSSAPLNYNMVSEEMLFQDTEGTIMAINNLSDIVALTIGERFFLPDASKNVFYEEIQAGTGSFLIQRKANILSQGRASGYGGHSETGSIRSVNMLTGSGSGAIESGTGIRPNVKLNLDEKFRIKTNYFFYLISGKSYKKFTSAKTLGKLFKGQESKIEAFAKEQSIDFSNIDDIARIVGYGYSLISKK